MSGLYGSAVMAPAALKTVIIEDVGGNKFTGVVTGEQVIFDATPNDVRLGKTFAGDEGVKIGENDIPSYHTTEGVTLVPVGSELKIELSYMNRYDYTKLQAIICAYNTSSEDSVAAEKIVINDNVYNVGETTSISTVSKNNVDKTIVLGVTNSGTVPLILRYFTYKEID